MPIEIARVVVAVIEAYMVAGAGFALLFLASGIVRLDHKVQASPKTLRLVLLPGIAALWPLFAWRWIARRPAPVEANAHRAKAGAR